MNRKIFRISKKFFLPSMVFFFAFVSIFGLSVCTAFTANMNMDSTAQQQMEDCIGAGQNMKCQMNVNDHTQGWQMIVNSLVSSEYVNILLAVFLFIALATLLPLFRLFSEYIGVPLRLYIKEHPNIRLYSFLQEIFSNGILQPQLYS